VIVVKPMNAEMLLRGLFLSIVAMWLQRFNNCIFFTEMSQCGNTFLPLYKIAIIIEHRNYCWFK